MTDFYIDTIVVAYLFGFTRFMEPGNRMNSGFSSKCSYRFRCDLKKRAMIYAIGDFKHEATQKTTITIHASANYTVMAVEFIITFNYPMKCYKILFFGIYETLIVPMTSYSVI